MSLTKGLVGHWSLDDELYNPTTKRVTDKSAYNNHGTSNNAGSFVSDRMGQADRAMDFNGSSDYVDCGNGESLTVDDLSVSLWGRSVDNNTCRSLVSKYYTEHELVLWSNDRFYFFKSDGVGGYELETKDVGWMHGIWHHVFYTFQSSTKELNMWLDDVLVWTLTFSSGSLSNSVNHDIAIGKRSGEDNHFKGSIADVRIYNRTLSPAERTLLYESYRPKTVIVQ